MVSQRNMKTRTGPIFERSAKPPVARTQVTICYQYFGSPTQILRDSTHREHALVETEEELRDAGTADRWVGQNAFESEVFLVANEG